MQVRKGRRAGIVPAMSQSKASNRKRERNEALIEALVSELKTRRGQVDLSQDELARRAGVNRSYIARLELAENQPTLCMMHDLAIALGYSLPELVINVHRRYIEKKTRGKELELLRENCHLLDDVK